MSITTQVISNTVVGNTVYTSGSNTAITWLSLNNWGAANVTANIFVVPNGDTATTSNQILYSLPLASGDTYQIYAAGEKLLLETGDFVQVITTANTVTAVTSYTSI
jgi:hypothetical protein